MLEIVSVAPVSMLIPSQTAAELIVGWRVAAAGMKTAVIAVGIPPHQFEALFQSVLLAPDQVLVPQALVALTLSFPVSVLPK